MTALHDAITASDLDRIRELLTNWTAPSIARELGSLTRVEQAVVIRVLEVKSDSMKGNRHWALDHFADHQGPKSPDHW